MMNLAAAKDLMMIMFGRTKFLVIHILGELNKGFAWKLGLIQDVLVQYWIWLLGLVMNSFQPYKGFSGEPNSNSTATEFVSLKALGGRRMQPSDSLVTEKRRLSDRLSVANRMGGRRPQVSDRLATDL
ncbi:hypothetical protein Tco_1216907 [Tanacetum coccineum]